MAVFIILAIIIVAVIAVRFFLRRVKLFAARNTAQKAPAENTKPISAVPDNPGLSDTETSEKLRVLQIVRRVNRITGPVFIASIFGFFIMHLGESMGLGEFFLKFLLPVGVVFVLMSVVSGKTGKRMKELKSLMGASVTLPILREVFEVKIYQPHGYIARDVIGSAGLVSGWEDISGSDYFEGSYRGINILYSDLYLSHKETDTDSDGNRTTKTVTDFLGQWMVCDFGKAFSASVRLFERTKFGSVLDIRKSDVETENVAFNKKFRIITEDGHTAFYLLTPHFMERLTAADEKADSSSRFYFGDGKVHIALYSGRDSFELGNVKTKDMEVVRQKFRKDVRYMTDIMDTLLLNDKLFEDGASERA